MSRLACRIAEIGEDLERRSIMSGHAERCLRCQVRVAREQRVRRVLRALRRELEPVPPWLEGAIASRVTAETPNVHRRTGIPRIVATSGAVVAGAAGAVALTLWRRTNSPA